jgi:hypothetical protein
MGYINKGDRTANGYSVGWRTWYRAKKLFFSPVVSNNTE